MFGLLLSAAGLMIVDVNEHPCIVVLGKIGVGVFAVLLIANLLPVCKRIWSRVRSGNHYDWDID